MSSLSPTQFARLIVALSVAMACSLPLSVACVPRSPVTGTMVVAVTLLPQAEFVEAIAGDLVDVVVMVPPGASPHTYEVTPEQMVALTQASLYAMVGTPVEFEMTWMDRLTEVNRDMLVVDCSRGVELIEAADAVHADGDEDDASDAGRSHTGADPHIWLSAQNAQVMVQNICNGLVQIDPENENVYRAGCAAYLDELSALDNELAAALDGLENRRFIVFHPSFGYFARDYNLIQIAVEQGGAEPDAQYVIRLIDEAREHGIRVVFASPQFSTRSAEVIASEIGGEVVLIDPLAGDYIPNMRSITAAILKVT